MSTLSDAATAPSTAPQSLGAPSGVEALLAEASALVAAGQARAAVSRLETALAELESTADVEAVGGAMGRLIAEELGDVRGACRALAQVNAAWPDTKGLRVLEARLLGASERYREALAAASSFSPREEDAAALAQDALGWAAQAGDATMAMRAAQHWGRLSPSAEALLSHVQACAVVGAYPAALASITDGLGANTDWQLGQDVGDALMDVLEHAADEPALASAVRPAIALVVDRCVNEAVGLRGLELEENLGTGPRRMSRVTMWRDRALDADDKNDAGRGYAAAAALLSVEDPEKAAEELDKALRLAPGDAAVLHRAQRVHAALGTQDAFFAWVTDTVQNTAEQSARAALALAAAEGASGDGALDLWLTRLEYAPDDGLAVREAVALVRTQEAATAVAAQLVRTAERSKSRVVQRLALKRAARLQMDVLGDPKAARETLEVLRARHGDDVKLLGELRGLDKALGDDEHAMAVLRASAKLPQPRAALKSVLEDLFGLAHRREAHAEALAVGARLLVLRPSATLAEDLSALVADGAGKRMLAEHALAASDALDVAHRQPFLAVAADAALAAGDSALQLDVLEAALDADIAPDAWGAWADGIDATALDPDGVARLIAVLQLHPDDDKARNATLLAAEAVDDAGLSRARADVAVLLAHEAGHAEAHMVAARLASRAGDGLAAQSAFLTAAGLLDGAAAQGAYGAAVRAAPDSGMDAARAALGAAVQGEFVPMERDAVALLDAALASGVLSAEDAASLGAYHEASGDELARYKTLIAQRDQASGEAKLALAIAAAELAAQGIDDAELAVEAWSAVALCAPAHDGAFEALRVLSADDDVDGDVYMFVTENAADALASAPRWGVLEAQLLDRHGASVDKRVAAWSRARAAQPEDPAVLMGAALVLEEAGHAVDAGRAWAARAERTDGEERTTALERAIALLEQPAPAVAGALLATAASAQPAPLAWWAQAVVCLQRAAEQDPSAAAYQALVEALSALADCESGEARADARVREARVRHSAIGDAAGALVAYEAALAHAPAAPEAIEGLRALVDDAQATDSVRARAGQTLLPLLSGPMAASARLAVLSVLTELSKGEERRRLESALCEALVDDADDADEAFDRTLAHLGRDPGDDEALARAERLAAQVDGQERLNALLAETAQGGGRLGAKYAARLAAQRAAGGDIEGVVAALEQAAANAPGQTGPLEQLLPHYRTLSRTADVTRTLEQLATLRTGDARRLTVFELVAHLFDVAEDVERGRRTLERALDEWAGDDEFLAQAEVRYRGFADWPALADVLARRAAAAGSPRLKVRHLVGRADVLSTQMDDLAGAVDGLQGALAVPDAGKAVDDAVQALERMAAIDADVGRRAREVLNAHYRETGALMPLADGLLALAARTAAADEKATLLDEAATVLVDGLRVPPRAQAAASEALVSAPSDDRVEALARIADLSGDFEGFALALVQAADGIRQHRPTEAAELWRRAAVITREKLDDREREAAHWHAVLALLPQDGDALERLAAINRERGDASELVDVLEQRARAESDPVALSATLLEAGRIALHEVGDPDRAESCLRQALAATPEDDAVLAELDTLYTRTENAAGLDDVLARRIAGTDVPGPLQARRAEVLLRRGKPAEALDALRAAVEGTPADDAVYTAALTVGTHARETGVPSIEDALACLETVVRTRANAEELAGMLDWRIAASTAPAAQCALQLELATLQEEQLGQPDLAFMTVYRALTLQPADEAIRANLERLAALSDNVEMLATLFESLADELDEGQGWYHRRVAELLLADPDGDRDDARTRLWQAAELGAVELVNLDALVELEEERGPTAQLADAVRRVADKARDEGLSQRYVAALRRWRDIERMLGRVDRALEAAELVLTLEPNDPDAAGIFEQLLETSGQSQRLAAQLAERVDAVPVTERAPVLLRLARLRHTQLHDLDGAVRALADLAGTGSTDPDLLAQLEAIWTEANASQPVVAARAAELLEPLHESAQNWTSLIRVRERLVEAAEAPEERSRLWSTIGDVYERYLDQALQAFMAVGRALMETPAETALRLRAQRLAVRLGDIETLLGLYEDVIERLPTDSALRVEFSVECGGLCEGSAGDPERALGWYAVAMDTCEIVGVADLKVAERAIEVQDRAERLAKVVGLADRLVRALQFKAWLAGTGSAMWEDPDDVARSALLEAAGIQTRGLGDHAGALDSLQRLVEKRPDDVEVLRAIGEAAERAGEIPEAVRALRRELDALGDVDEARQAEIRLRLAQLSPDAEDDDAVGHLAEVLARDPRNVAARGLLEARIEDGARFDDAAAQVLLSAYEGSSEWKLAADLMQKRVESLEKRGDRFAAFALRTTLAAMQEEKLGAPQFALMTLCGALPLAPEDAGLHRSLMRLADANGAHEELAEILEDQAVTLDGLGRGEQSAGLRERAAHVWSTHLEDDDEAVRLLEHVLERQPGRDSALEAVADLYDRAGRAADLERVLRHRLLFVEDPIPRAALLLRVAQLLVADASRTEEAVPVLDEVRTILPTDARARAMLTDAVEALGQTERLRALLEETVADEGASDASRAEAQRRLATLLTAAPASAVDAATQWEAVLAASPMDPGALDALEKLYPTLGKHDALHDLLAMQLEQSRDPLVRTALHRKLATLLAGPLDRPADAVAHQQRLLEADAHDADAMAALRVLLRRVEDWEGLVSLLRRLMRHQGDLQELKALRFEMAEVLGDHLGRGADAVEAGRRILDVEPHTAEGLERLAGLFERHGALDERARVLSMLAGKQEGEGRVGTLLEQAAMFESQLDRPERAMEAYERVLQVEPAHAHAGERLTTLYAAHGRWQKWVSLKEAEAARMPLAADRARLLAAVAQVLEERLGQKDMAFLTLCRALQADPEFMDLTKDVERLAVETDSVEELVAVYEHAATALQDDAQIVRVYLRVADLAWRRLQDADEAVDYLTRALDYDANNAVALERLGEIYIEDKRWDSAVSILERQAERSEERVARAHLLWKAARLLTDDAGEVERGVAMYERVLALEPGRADVLRELVERLEANERWADVVRALGRLEALADTDEDRLALRYRTAGIWEQQLQNAEQAIMAYRGVLALDGTHVLTLRALERLFTGLGRAADLLDVFEQMVVLASDDDEKRRLLTKIAGTWEEAFGNLDKAIEANTRILDSDPKNLVAIRALERLYRETEQWPALIEILNVHVGVSDAPGAIVGLYLDIGNTYYKHMGQVDKAEGAFNAARDFDPNSLEATHALAQLYERSGNWFNALEMLDHEARLQSNAEEAAEVYTRVGRINEDMLLDMAAAKAAYTRAVELAPTYVPALQALREVARKDASDEAYLDMLRREAEATTEPTAKAELFASAGAYVVEHEGDRGEAIEAYERALALVPGHRGATEALAQLVFAAEDWPRAEELLDAVIEHSDAESAQDLARVHYRLAYTCQQLDKAQKALKHYQRSYELDPTYLPALEGLGASLASAERWDDAARIYQTVLIHHREGLTDAEVVEYYAVLADLNHKLGQADRAVKNLERGLQLNPTHVRSLELLAAVYEVMGEFDDAYEVMRRLAPLVPVDARLDLLVATGRLAQAELDDAYAALEAYEEAQHLDPTDRRTLEALFQLYRETRQAPRAVEVLEALVQLETDERARVRLNHQLGELYRDELENEGRALQFFNAALDLDPAYVRAFEAIETMLTTNRNWRALEENYKAMIARLKGEHGTMKTVLWRNLGELYRRVLKNPQAAAEAYKLLARMSPGDAGVLGVLADTLFELPARTDEAIAAYQELMPHVVDQPTRVLHQLAELYLRAKRFDAAYLVCTVLEGFGELRPKEAKLLEYYKKNTGRLQRSMTPKLFGALLAHPQARGPLATLSEALYTHGGQVLMRSAKELRLEKPKEWAEVDLTAQVVPLVVSRLRELRDVLGVASNLRLFMHRGQRTPLTPLPTPFAALAVGEGSPILRDMPERELWFRMTRQLAYLHPAFVLPRTLGPDAFAQVVHAVLLTVAPSYPVQLDKRVLADVQKRLSRLPPAASGRIRQAAEALLQSGEKVDLASFYTGIEHTAVRVGYLFTGDLALAARLARQAEASTLPVGARTRMRALTLFAVSEAHIELRERLGLAVQA